MTEAFPAIAEAAATGNTAELFADIRATVGVRVVNLVWRHLATIDDALPWAWQMVKPLYVQGTVDRAVVDFRRAMVVPKLMSLAGTEPRSVDAVLLSYDHSNTVNLFALGALVAFLRGDAAAQETLEQGPRLPPPDVPLPPLLSEADVSPDVWQRVLRLNRFGDRPEPVILASMYRHLAHAPDFLLRLEAALGPVHADGSLGRAILANRRTAYRQSRVLAGVLPAGLPVRGNDIEGAVSSFVEHAIGKMVTICRAVRAARAVLSS